MEIGDVDQGLEALESAESARDARTVIDGLVALGNRIALPFIIGKTLELNNQALYAGVARELPMDWKFEAHEYVNIDALDSKKKIGAVSFLRMLDTLGARQILVELMHDPDFMVRREVMGALKEMTDLGEPLEQAVAEQARVDDEKIVRWAACEVLVNQNTESALDHLKELKREFRKDDRIPEYHQQLQNRLSGRYGPGMTVSSGWLDEMKQSLLQKDEKGNLAIWSYAGYLASLAMIVGLMGFIVIEFVFNPFEERKVWLECPVCQTRFRAVDRPDIRCPVFYCRAFIHEGAAEKYGTGEQPYGFFPGMMPSMPLEETYDAREHAAPTPTPTPDPWSQLGFPVY